MKIDIENIIKKLDLLCFIVAIIGTIVLIMFEFNGEQSYFKISMIIYLVAMIIFFVLAILRFTVSFTDKDNENLKLSAGGRVRCSLLIIYTLFCSFWFAFMTINI